MCVVDVSFDVLWTSHMDMFCDVHVLWTFHCMWCDVLWTCGVMCCGHVV